MDEAQAAKLSMFAGMPAKYGGGIWVTDGILLPLLMDVDVMGTHNEWRVATIDDWTVDESMFAVPEGYEIQELDPSQMPWEMEEPEISEEEAPALGETA